LLDLSGLKREKGKENDDLENVKKMRRNAEIDHEVSILKQKAAKKRKVAAQTYEKAKRLELDAVEYENKASDLDKTKVQ
jgi:uncharacterized protein YqeY